MPDLVDRSGFFVYNIDMNVKFKKNVTVDYENARTTDVGWKNFYRGDVLEDVTIEKLSKNFSNIHFVNGDLAISVPNDAFTSV